MERSFPCPPLTDADTGWMAAIFTVPIGDGSYAGETFNRSRRK